MVDRLQPVGTNVLLIGDINVGKSSLINYLQTRKFDDTIIPSIENTSVSVKGKDLKITVMDTPGIRPQDKRNEPFVIPQIPKCAVIIFVFDKTDRCSFDQIRYLKDTVDDHVRRVTEFILVGNKLDDIENLVVSTEEGQQRCHELKMNDFFETSAKDGTNVLRLFTDAAERLKQMEMVIGSTIQLQGNNQSNQRGCNCC